MSSRLSSPVTEAIIFARLVHSQPLTSGAAEYLLGFRFTQADQSRMQELADTAQAGTLTEADEREFDSYLHVGNLLAVMQSKARLALYGRQSSADGELSGYRPASL